MSMKPILFNTEMVQAILDGRMFLRTEKGIVKTPKFSRFKSLFCKHSNPIVGEPCSENGLSRISGIDNYAKGSCLWASEIEEFPIAVTKLRFGG